MLDCVQRLTVVDEFRFQPNPRRKMCNRISTEKIYGYANISRKIKQASVNVNKIRLTDLGGLGPPGYALARIFALQYA